jgi:hypothetical protein
LPRGRPCPPSRHIQCIGATTAAPLVVVHITTPTAQLLTSRSHVAAVVRTPSPPHPCHLSQRIPTRFTPQCHSQARPQGSRCRTQANAAGLVSEVVRTTNTESTCAATVINTGGSKTAGGGMLFTRGTAKLARTHTLGHPRCIGATAAAPLVSALPPLRRSCSHGAAVVRTPPPSSPPSIRVTCRNAPQRESRLNATIRHAHGKAGAEHGRTQPA